MASGKNRLAHNFFSLGLVQVVNSLLQLLVIPYVIARTGVSNFGIIAVAQVVMYYMGTFTDYGFNQTASREVSINRENNGILSSIFSKVYTMKIILCVIAMIILILLSFVFSFIRDNFLLYCMAFMFVPGYASIPGWFLQGMERMKLLALINLASRIIFVVLVFAFIKGPEHTSLFIFFFGAGNLMAGIAGIFITTRLFHLKFKRPPVNEITREFKRGWTVTVTNLSMNIIQYGNLFILRLFTNDLVAGYFSVAERVFFTMKQALTIFSQAVYPRVCQLAAAAPRQLIPFYKRVFTPFFIALLTGSLLVFIFSPLVLRFFVKEGSEHSVFVLRMLCLVLPVIGLGIPFTLNLLAFDMRHRYFFIYTGATLLNILTNVLLVSFFEETGTLVAIFITEIFITLCVFFAGSRYAKHNVSSTGNLNQIRDEIQ